MGLNPGRYPSVCFAPRSWVSMVGPEVDGWDGQVTCEVETWSAGIWVRSVCASIKSEPFVADADHMIGIKGFDISRCRCDPVGDDRRCAARAAWFVGEFPGKNGSGCFVSCNHGRDILLVLCLGGGRSVPIRDSNAIITCVGSHSSVVSPIVDKVDDEADPVCFSRLHNVVETLKAVGSRVDHWVLPLDEGLIPNCVAARQSGNVVETPDSKDLQSGLFSVVRRFLPILVEHSRFEGGTLSDQCLHYCSKIQCSKCLFP